MDTTSDVTTNIKVWSSGTMICATRTIFRHPSTKLRVGDDQTLSHTPIRLSAATVSVRASSSSRSKLRCWISLIHVGIKTTERYLEDGYLNVCTDQIANGPQLSPQLSPTNSKHRLVGLEFRCNRRGPPVMVFLGLLNRREKRISLRIQKTCLSRYLGP